MVICDMDASIGARMFDSVSVDAFEAVGIAECAESCCCRR